MKIKLEKIKKGDSKILKDFMNDPYVLKENGFYKKTYNIQDAKEAIERQIKNREHLFIIFLDNLPVGRIGLISPDATHKIYEIGYIIKKEYSGKGIATKALKEISKIGFSKFKLVRIWAKVLPSNKASCKVLEKAGFKKEGHLKKSFYLNKKYNDEIIYGKTK